MTVVRVRRPAAPPETTAREPRLECARAVVAFEQLRPVHLLRGVGPVDRQRRLLRVPGEHRIGHVGLLDRVVDVARVPAVVPEQPVGDEPPEQPIDHEQPEQPGAARPPRERSGPGSSLHLDRRALLLTGAGVASTAAALTFAPAEAGSKVTKKFTGRFGPSTKEDWHYLPFHVPKGVRQIAVSYTYPDPLAGPDFSRN